MKKIYVFRAGKVRTLKVGVDLQDYLTKYPDAKKISAPPGLKTLEKMVNDGVAKAVDGCRIEPDGKCQHGMPSWLLALGYI